jgi:hypothetical protein
MVTPPVCSTGRPERDAEPLVELVVRTAVTGIGLVAAVPITTALAATIAARGTPVPRPAAPHRHNPGDRPALDDRFPDRPVPARPAFPHSSVGYRYDQRR